MARIFTVVEDATPVLGDDGYYVQPLPIYIVASPDPVEDSAGNIIAPLPVFGDIGAGGGGGEGQLDFSDSDQSGWLGVI